jgi:hypothetical protein
MPQAVAEPAHGIHRGSRRDFGHALGADPDDRFDQALKTALYRVDGLLVARESLEIAARQIAFDPVDVLDDVPQPQRLALAAPGGQMMHRVGGIACLTFGRAFPAKPARVRSGSAILLRLSETGTASARWGNGWGNLQGEPERCTLS